MPAGRKARTVTWLCVRLCAHSSRTQKENGAARAVMPGRVTAAGANPESGWPDGNRLLDGGRGILGERPSGNRPAACGWVLRWVDDQWVKRGQKCAVVDCEWPAGGKMRDGSGGRCEEGDGERVCVQGDGLYAWDDGAVVEHQLHQDEA